jgi:hypothetical protein
MPNHDHAAQLSVKLGGVIIEMLQKFEPAAVLIIPP